MHGLRAAGFIPAVRTPHRRDQPGGSPRITFVTCYKHRTGRASVSKVAFLFPGQGAQTVGMGRALVETSPAARQLYEEAAHILKYDLAELCFRGPEVKLNSTAISQPAIFVTSLAALEY